MSGLTAFSYAPRGATVHSARAPLEQVKQAPTALAAAAAAAEGFEGTAGSLVGCLTAALASRAITRKRSRNQLRADVGGKVVMVKTPAETYEALVEKGVGNTKMSVLQTLHSSIYGGFYVGMAGLLSLAISGNMVAPSISAQRFVFAALFPVNLLLVLQSGAQLFTGNTATLSMAFYEGKATGFQVLRSWVLSWIGNVIGCGTMAVMAWYTQLLTGGTADLAIATVAKKCHYGFGITIVKAIMCNWLVCMAVYLCTQANDLTGKMVGIWFPISCFVAIGFEHIPANMFMIPLGMMAGADVSVLDCLIKNFIPVTLGNIFAGSICVGAGYSFAFGRLGQNNKSHLPVSRVSREDLKTKKLCYFALDPNAKLLVSE